MAMQIANPEVVRKIEWLATALNTSKTAAVERALDAYKLNLALPDQQSAKQRRRDEFMRDVLPILAQFDALPSTQASAKNDLDWDENGLPT
jgi:antitoxin VapB